MRTLVALGVLAVATTFLGRRFGLHDVRFLGSEVALLVGIFVILRYVLPLVDRHDRGAKGEEQVGGLLATMSGDGWLFIHDASFGHGNVDHIAIGPGGVFTIETKSHPGPVRVGRIHGATLRQAQSQQKLIAQITGETVQPLIVFSRAWVDRPLSRRKGVRVLPARMLVGYLNQRKPILDPGRIERANWQIADALAEYSLLERRPMVGQTQRAISIRRRHLPRHPPV
jgi:Nuclease-related domain